MNHSPAVNPWHRRRAEPVEASVATDASAAPVASAVQSGPPPVDARRCEAESIGGWTGSAACNALAALNIPGAHKTCASDSDCRLIGGACSPRPTNAAHEAYWEQHSPCGNPAAGACVQRSKVACRKGCCVVTDLLFH